MKKIYCKACGCQGFAWKLKFRKEKQEYYCDYCYKHGYGPKDGYQAHNYQTEIELRLPDNCRPFDQKLQTDKNIHIDPDGLGSGNLFNHNQ